MSYIHEALLKAQKEKDAGSFKYQRALLGSKGKPGIFSGRPAWLISLFVILLAFTLYSWLHFKDRKTIVVSKNLKPEVSSQPDIFVKVEDFYERARHFHKIGHLQDAKRLYQKALMLEPGNVSVLNNLGVIYIQEGKYSEARNSLENAIRLKPEYIDPYYNSACLYALKGEVRKSLNNLKQAISLDKSVREWARKDSDLQNLRGVPEFEEIIAITK